MKPILLIGEAMGEAEAKTGVGFVGTSGAELLRMLADAHVIDLTATDTDYLRKYYRTRDPWMLNAVWELHPEVVRTNVFQLHPPGNELEHLCGERRDAILGYPKSHAGWVRAEYAPELDRLGDEILAHDPNLIIALGNTPLWALGGCTGVTKLRGTTRLSTHTVSGYKLLCTYHPAAVCRQWELRPTTVIDLQKANHEATFPEVRRPKVEIWIEPDLDDIRTFTEQHIHGCGILSVDIETSGNQITCVGFAPRSDLALVVPIHDSRSAHGSYWPSASAERSCWELIRNILEDPSILKLFQNGLYDIAFLLRAYGIKVRGATHDTMLLHHALQPEALKGLGYLGSVYTDHGPWKTEHKEQTIGRDK